MEKYLKALLVWRCIRFPKTHSIGELVRLVPQDGRPQISPEEQERLTDYAAVARYPGLYDPIGYVSKVLQKEGMMCFKKQPGL